MISIHAPREGSDQLALIPDAVGRQFQSTLPVRGATASANAVGRRALYFNPRSP